MPQKSTSQRRRSRVTDEGRILTRALIRAAERLDISQKALAAIIGVSEPTVSRMRRGSIALDRHKGKSFELAMLFVRVATLLDAIVTDDQTAKMWLRSENSALQGIPLELMQCVQGLVASIRYLEARSELGH